MKDGSEERPFILETPASRGYLGAQNPEHDPIRDLDILRPLVLALPLE